MTDSDLEANYASGNEPATSSGDWMYLNGEYVPVAEAKLSVVDHSFLYGDGVFEGIRAYGGRVWMLDEHIGRLFNSLKVVLIPMELTQKEVRDIIRKVLRLNNLSDAYIRVTVSRGSGLGLDPKNFKDATVAIMTSKLALYPAEKYETGLHVVTVSTRIPSPDSWEVRVKSTGKYLNNIMAKFEANRAGAGEGLMLNRQGYIAEATGDNIFIVSKGKLITPPPSAGILEGITRDVVMDIAQSAGYGVEQSDLTLFDVYTADEAFLTGTAAEIIPMVRLDACDIGTGRPGPITQRIMERFRARTASEGVPIED